MVDKVKRRPLNDAEIWRLAQSKTNKPLPFGTCCSQAMGSFFELQYISPGLLISSSDCDFGLQPLRWFFDSPAALLPWALVVGMLMLAFGIDKIIPRPSWLVRLTARTKLRTGKFSAHGAAGTMGLLTPLLPCGPLYMVFGVALLSASPQKGAEFTLAFGLGTVPLLWIGAQQFSRWRMKLQPRSLQLLQRALMLVAALLIAWRMHDTLPFGAEKQIGEEKLPSCCREEKPQEHPRNPGQL